MMEEIVSQLVTWRLSVAHCNVCHCRALRLGLLTQDMIDMYDPALMFTIPRLAIVRYVAF